MARLRWVQAMLREWAAWIEGFGSELHSPALNDLPRGNFFRLQVAQRDVFVAENTAGA